MRAIALAALAGCSFDPTSATTSDAPGHAGGDAAIAADAPTLGGSGSGSGVGSGSGSGSATPSLCAAPDQTGIVLCLELDDADLGSANSTARDGSPGRHDATVTNSDVTTRTVPSTSQAELISTSQGATQATIEAGDGSDFDVQQLTLMAWVYPTSTPQVTNTYGLIEKTSQYVLAINDDGDLLCEVQGKQGDIGTSVGDPVPLNQWSLVACTFNGTSDSAALCTYVLAGASGESQARCEAGPNGGQIATNGGVGPVLGSRYSAAAYNHLYGSIDSIRIFDRVLTQTEICTGGGRTGC